MFALVTKTTDFSSDDYILLGPREQATHNRLDPCAR
jgi:hypothetical protein